MNNSPPRVPGEDSTGVDLGEDLLFEKPPLEAAAAEPRGESAFSQGDPSEQIRNATILVNEGFFEDAKRVLRRLLIADPHCVPARQKLDEIHELELKQILSSRESTGFIDRRKKPEPWVAPEEVLRRLDADLGLGVLQEPLASLLAEPAAVERFAALSAPELEGTSPRDRLDLGIAFLEMGLPELAILQFEAAGAAPEFRIPAACLQATAQLARGRSLEAIEVLEPLACDQDIEKADKLELIYLMGRAHEARSSREDALGWYRQVLSLDRHYRDTEERIRKMGQRRSE